MQDSTSQWPRGHAVCSVCSVEPLFRPKVCHLPSPKLTLNSSSSFSDLLPLSFSFLGRPCPCAFVSETLLRETELFCHGSSKRLGLHSQLGWTECPILAFCTVRSKMGVYQAALNKPFFSTVESFLLVTSGGTCNGCSPSHTAQRVPPVSDSASNA